MKNTEIYEPVSVLSLIDIEKLAESYRRKSFGCSEKRQDTENKNIFYTFRPDWKSWNIKNSKVFLNVKVSIFVDQDFAGSRFLCFQVFETSLGIKARCCKQPKLRFGLSSKRFLEAAFDEFSKTYLLTPITPRNSSQFELAL